MLPVSEDRGVSWLPATMMIGDLGPQCLPQPLELPEGEHDRGIGRAHRMEQVTGDHHHVGTLRR